jgi:hypothetical protein
MNTLGDAVTECQGLLGDPDGEWVTRGYILPFIGTAYRMAYLYLKNATGRNLEGLVEVLNVLPGTTSLYPFQAAGKPLAGLTDPLQVWWKPAGQPPNWYRQMNPKETLPFVAAPGISSNFIGSAVCFTWRGNQLTITPMAQPVDIMVDGRFNPPPLIDDKQILVVSPDIQSPLSLGACAIAGVERSNPAVLAGYAQQSEMGLDNIAADLIRQKQLFPKRLGKVAPQYGGEWGWYR